MYLNTADGAKGTREEAVDSKLIRRRFRFLGKYGGGIRFLGKYGRGIRFLGKYGRGSRFLGKYVGGIRFLM